MNFAKKAALAMAGMAALGAQAQSGATPKFEVASVKAVKECGAPEVVAQEKGKKLVRKGGVRALTPGRLNVCTTLKELINSSYVTYADDPARRPRAIEGGPAWLDSDLFEIDAKANGAPGQGTMSGPMMRALLAERFQLKTRIETREIPAYALTVAKSGLKAPRTKEGSCTVVDWTKHPPPPAEGEKPYCDESGIRGEADGVQWDLTGTGMTEFAERLGGLIFDRPVIDRTGVTGMFDFHLEFGYDIPSGKLRRPPAALPDDPDGPTMFTALEKLGLKLEPVKQRGEFLVIDRVEKPSEN